MFPMDLKILKMDYIFFRINELNDIASLEENSEKLNAILGRETIVVLYAGMAGPVARDMESKFSEKVHHFLAVINKLVFIDF